MNDSTSNLRQHQCCFIGHRPEKLGISETRAKALLKSAIQQAISDGYVTFISGMARGIDLWATEIVIEEREKMIIFILSVPYHSADLKADGRNTNRLFTVQS